MHRRLLVRVAFAAGLGMLTAGVVASSAGAQAGNTVIRVATGPSDPSTSLVFADKMGYFKRAGLDVELSKGATTSTMAAAVAGGSIDIAQGAPLGIVQIISKGVPLTVVGSMARYNADKPDVALLMPTSSPIKSAQDFGGKTLSGVAGGEVRVIGYPYESIGKHYTDALIVARSNWAAENATLVRRFLEAFAAANAYVVAHEAEGDAVMAQYAGLDPSTATSIHHPERVVTIAPNDLQPVIDAAARASRSTTDS